MPSLDFYALDTDQRAVLAAVFRLGGLRVFEAYSDPDTDLRGYADPEEIPAKPHGLHLMLHAVDSGPGPTVERFDLKPSAITGVTFRHRCQGWGLIQLHLGGFSQEHGLSWSHTNHNTSRRAEKWTDAYPELGDPGAWDWAAITRASSRLNRAIRSLAVDKIGSHPVLPAAAQLIRREGLKYEYGTGIHARPPAGMTRNSQHAQ